MPWWTDRGYPPFAPCTCGCGFPHAGQVVKYYRRHAKMSQLALAEKLGVTKKAIWVMENKNTKIDWEKRQLLCDALKIAPALLGVTMLSEIIKEGFYSSSTTKGPVNTEEHQQFLAEAKMQYRHGGSGDLLILTQVGADVLYRELPHVSSYEKEEFYQLLWEYHVFASSLLRRAQQYDASLKHLNRAMDFADALKNDELRAVCLIKSGQRLNDASRIKQAIQTFEVARMYERSIPQYLNGIRMFDAGQAYAKDATTLTDKKTALSLVDRGGQLARSLPDSNYAHCFDFSIQRYHLSRGEVLATIGWNREALEELSLVQSDPVSWWRAHQNILEAWAYTQDQNIPMAVSYAEAALSIIKQFDSEPYEVDRVASIHSQLAASPYANSPDVAHLRHLLRS